MAQPRGLHRTADSAGEPYNPDPIMDILIPDAYQAAVRGLDCFPKLAGQNASPPFEAPGEVNCFSNSRYHQGKQNCCGEDPMAPVNRSGKHP